MMAPEPQTTTTQKTSHSVGVNVTTKSETTPVIHSLELNYLYFIRTIPGILKLVVLLLAIICMGCASPVVINYGHFFMFVVVVFFIITLILSLFHFLTIPRLLPQVPWLLVELLVTVAAVILYFIAMVVMLAMTSKMHIHFILSRYGYYSPYIAAGVFALFNTVAYGCAAFFHFQEWKGSRSSATNPAPNGVGVPPA